MDVLQSGPDSDINFASTDGRFISASVAEFPHDDYVEDGFPLDDDVEDVEVEPPTRYLKYSAVSPDHLHAYINSERVPHHVRFVEAIVGKRSGYADDGCLNESDFAKCEFFEQEHNLKGAGLLAHTSKVFSIKNDHLPWVLLALRVGAHLLQNTQSGQADFCLIFNMYTSLLESKSRVPIVIPSSFRQASSYYTNQSLVRGKGRTSLLATINLTQPELLDQDHTYLSLCSSIRFMHATGNILEPSFLIDFKSGSVLGSTFLHSRTPRGWSILTRALGGLGCQGINAGGISKHNVSSLSIPQQTSVTYVVGVYSIILWSDSFEAMATKQNRGSVWVLFASVATPSVSDSEAVSSFNSGKNTVLVAIGPSGKDVSHDCVFRRLRDDLDKLFSPSDPFTSYSRFHQKEMRSLYSVYVYLQDTPERTESNGLASWKSHNNILFGVLSPLVDNQDRLPSCENCHRRRLAGFESLRCSQCLDWNPPDQCVLTYSHLAEVVTAACNRIGSQIKTRQECVLFLRAAGIGPKLAEHVWTASQSGSHPQVPSIWGASDHIEVGDSIEVVMHLLFLGIVRSLAKDVLHTFLAARKQWSTFTDRVNDVLQRAQSLSLYWLRTQPINTSSFGGWVSENYLALGRVIKFIAILTDSLESTDLPYVDPPGPPSVMSMAELRRWLLARNISVSKPTGQERPTKKDYLNTVTATGWSRPGDDPQIAISAGQSVPLRVFEDVVVSCHSMLCSVMGVRDLPSQADVDRIDRNIKLYLTFDHYFHTWGRNLPSSSTPFRSNGRPAIHLAVPFRSTRRHRRVVEVDLDIELDDLCFAGADESDGSVGSLSDGSVGSLSDGSGGEPAVVADFEHTESRNVLKRRRGITKPAQKRIPALARRNKINLLMLPETIKRVGSYQYLSELGPKGEGAIQVIKPIIKKLGGVKRYKKWSTLAAGTWLKRRCSKAAIAMTVDGIEARAAEVGNVDATFVEHMTATYSASLAGGDDGPNGNGRIPSNKGIPLRAIIESTTFLDQKFGNKKMFVVYRDREEVVRLLAAGVAPLSSVMMQSSDSRNPFSVAIRCSTAGRVMMLPLEPRRLLLETGGVSLFEWVLSDAPRYQLNSENSELIDDYCLHLPVRCECGGQWQTVYYTITYWWREMLSDRSMGSYSLRSPN